MKGKNIFIAITILTLVIMTSPVTAFAYVDGTEEIGVLGSFYSNREYDIDRTAYTTVYGYSEMVTYVEEKWGEQIMFGVSLNPFYFYSKRYDHGEFVDDFRGSYSQEFYINAFVSDYNGDEFFYQGVPYSLGVSGLGTYGFSESDFKLFDNRQHAVEYLVTGSLNGLIDENIKPFQYSENVTLEDFDFDVHYSNYPRDYYIRFYFKPSELMTASGNWEIDLNYVSTITTKELNYFDDGLYIDGDTITLTSSDAIFYQGDGDENGYYYYNFYPYKNLSKDERNKYMFSGVEALHGLIDLDNIDLPLGFNFGDIIRVDTSILEFKLTPKVSGINGNQFNVFVDCLSPENSYTTFSVPTYDEENDKYIDDYKPVSGSLKNVKDYYKTILTVDENGNKQYQHYYIDVNGVPELISVDSNGNFDINVKGKLTVNGNINVGGNVNHVVGGGLSHELEAVVNVVFPDNINLNVNGNIGGSSGSSENPWGDIVINDDDYNNGQFVDDVSNLWGLKDDMQTAAEDDGPFEFLKDFMGVLPPDVMNMTCYGISSVVIVGLLRFLLKR